MRDKNTLLILEMFNEKEDFMRQLFGIVTTSKSTLTIKQTVWITVRSQRKIMLTDFIDDLDYDIWK